MQLVAYLFAISHSTISQIFNEAIHVMDRHLVPALVMWPELEQLRLSMPLSFEKCACIIDCFEILIERDEDLKARAQTHSQYKSHNTRKYLIEITPQGRVSDKYITNNSEFLDNLIPEDVILGDHGFDVQDSVGLYNCTNYVFAE